MPADSHRQRLAREVQERAMAATKPFLDLAKRSKPADSPMVLVPREPTPEMVRAWRGAVPKEAEPTEDGGWSAPADVWFRAQWQAALSASPARTGEGMGALQPQAASVPTEQAGGPVVGWQPIETVECQGQKIEVRHKDGREYPLWANAEWRPEASRHYTHWRPAPSTTSTAEQVGSCPVCGCEERTGAGYLQCECPAPSPGEGDAPVAWQVGRAVPMFYTSQERADYWRACGETVIPLYTRPTPATPEGLREKVARRLFAEIHAHEDWGAFDERFEARGKRHHPMQEKAFRLADIALATLQPQAQGGE